MKKIAAVLVTCFALLSCYAPVDLSLSQAAAILSNPSVTYRTTIGPVSDYDQDAETPVFMFLPAKTNTGSGIDFTTGFLLMRTSTGTRVGYAHTSGSDTTVFGWWGADYANPVPAYEPYLFEPFKFVSPGIEQRGGLLGMNPLDPTGNSVQVVGADLVNKCFTYPGGGWINIHDNLINLVGPGPLYDADPIGFSVYPTDFGQTWDDTYWLVRERGTGKLMELTMRLDALNGLWNKLDTKAPLFPFDMSDLVGVTRCNYFFDPDMTRAPTDDQKKSYVSWYDAATGWKCLSWKGTATIESVMLTDVTHRIDALLTNGMLFSTEDGVGRLYSAEGGSWRPSSPWAACDLSGSVSSTGCPPRSSRSPGRSSGQDWSGMFIDVYSVKTADLAGL